MCNYKILISHCLVNCYCARIFIAIFLIKHSYTQLPVLPVFSVFLIRVIILLTGHFFLWTEKIIFSFTRCTFCLLTKWYIFFRKIRNRKKVINVFRIELENWIDTELHNAFFDKIWFGHTKQIRIGIKINFEVRWSYWF